MSQQSLALMWHRRDLRLLDNAALYAATTQYRQVVGVFILDADILKRSDTAPVRVQFMLDALSALQTSYAELGGQLLLRQGEPLAVLRQLATDTQAAAVVWNRDVEPYAITRDLRVADGLSADGIEAIAYQDMLLHDPSEIFTKSSNKPYSVYSPFWRNWSARPKASPYDRPTHLVSPDAQLQSLPIPSLADLGMICTQDVTAASEHVALDLLEQFWIGGTIWTYDEYRNLPAESGTSLLSPHLRWGTLGIRQIWQATVEAETEIRSDEAEASLKTWRQELCWREFYKHALFHWPHLETQAFRPDFDRFDWDNSSELFDAWCTGQTGYPIVDAAMRQLNETGWMHNRCRMIVASFLTKDLFVDWRWGERYFMQQLVDGDLAANNGGWQWSASVGTDPKPLRIFNPTTQASRYDAEGEYIRRYVPELAGIDSPALFAADPISQRIRQDCGYPTPIVDHKLRQREFKVRYSACKL